MELVNPIKLGAEMTGAPEAALALIVALVSAMPLALLYVEKPYSERASCVCALILDPWARLCSVSCCLPHAANAILIRAPF